MFPLGGGYLGLYSLLVEPEEIDFIGEPATIGLSWVEVSHVDAAGADKTYLWAPVDLVDATDYYGGFKEARILSISELQRALSDKQGQYESASFGWVQADTDRLVRGLLGNTTTKYLANRMAVVRMISDADRRLRRKPRVVARGVIRSYKPVSPFHFTFQAEDFLSSKFGSANLEKVIPQRVITTTDFPNAPAASLERRVPIIYGHLTDETEVIGGLDSPSVVASVVGPAGSSTYTFAFTALDNRNGQAFNFDKRNDHAGETDPTFVTVTNAPAFDDLSGTNYIHFDITAPDAHHCRVYIQAGDGGFYLLDQTDEIAAPDHFYDYGQRNGVRDVDSIKWDCSPPTSNNTDVLDQGRGLVPVIYAGLREVASVNVHEFVLCGHAVKAVDGFYQAGIRISNADVTAEGIAASTVDYNGRRYTVIHVDQGGRGDRAANGSEPLTVNVQGIEDVGDGSGDLIEQLADIYLHFVQNFGFQAWESGAWLASPEWPEDVDGTILSQIDEASFATLRAVHERRLPDGYPGGFVLGAENEAINLRTAVARLNLSCDCQCGFNRNSQFFVSIFDESIAILNAARTYTQVLDIDAESFDLDTQVPEVENLIVYSYGRRYAEGTWDAPDQEVEDAASIAAMRETKRSTSPLELWAVRSAAVASDIAQRRLLYYKEPPVPVIFNTDLRGLSSELGDVIKVTHTEGLSATGWSAQPLRIMRHHANPSTYGVRIEAVDVQRLYQGAFILGDVTALAADWATADDDDRRYGYLGDRTTGEFSTGDPAKRLR